MNEPYPTWSAIVRRFAAALIAVMAAVPPAGATAPTPSMIDDMPLVARLTTAEGLESRPAPALWNEVEHALQRLAVNEAHAALDTPDDLIALVGLAARIELLQRAGESSPGLRRAALTTAYMLHLAGHAYEERAVVRRHLDKLPGSVPPGTRPLAQDLLDSVKAMRGVGREWFPKALFAVMQDKPEGGAVHHQRGLWLEREGRLDEAIEAFAQAFAAEEKARFALSLYRTLLAAKRTAEAQRLERSLIAAAPALTGRLAKIARDDEDDRLTAAFDAGVKDLTVAQRAAQVRRYLRVGRADAAEVLAEALLTEAPTDPIAWYAAAELYLRRNKHDQLMALLARATSAGMLDARLQEARIAGIAGARVNASLSGTPSTLAEQDSGPDLAALRARDPARGALVTRANNLLVPIAEWVGAHARGADSPTDEVVKVVEAEIAAGLAESPASVAMAKLAAAAYVAIDKPRAALSTLRKRLRTLAPADRAPVAFLLAQIEAGYAVRWGDQALLKKALKRLASLGPTRPAGVDKASWQYLGAIAPLLGRTIRGATLAAEDVRAALNDLPRLGLDVDETTAEGRLLTQGLAASSGALLFVIDQQEQAITALKDVRRVVPEEPIAKLVAGQAALMGGDVGGAYQLLKEARAVATRPPTAFMAEKWLTYAANTVGSPKDAHQHVKRLLDLWDDAKIPDKVEPRSPRALFVGDFHIGVEMEPGVPLAAVVRANPVVLLIPDIPHDRDELKQALTPDE